MSQVILTTTTTTLLVTVVSFGALPINTVVTVASTSVGLATSSQHDVVLPPQLILRYTMRGSVGFTTVLHSSSSPRCLLRHMPWVLCRWVFSFKVEHPTNSCVVCWYRVHFLVSGSHIDAVLTIRGSTVGVCITTMLWGIYAFS